MAKLIGNLEIIWISRPIYALYTLVATRPDSFGNACIRLYPTTAGIVNALNATLMSAIGLCGFGNAFGRVIGRGGCVWVCAWGVGWEGMRIYCITRVRSLSKTRYKYRKMAPLGGNLCAQAIADSYPELPPTAAPHPPTHPPHLFHPRRSLISLSLRPFLSPHFPPPYLLPAALVL